MQLISSLTATGWAAAIWMIATGLFLAVSAKRTPRSGLWVTVASLLAMCFLSVGLRGPVNSPWLFAALAGSMLLAWIITTPLLTKWSGFFVGFLTLLASLMMLLEFAFGVSWFLIRLVLSDKHVGSPWLQTVFGMWQILSIGGLLAVCAVKGWFTQRWFRQLSLTYLAALLVTTGLPGLTGAAPSFYFQKPLLHITALAAALLVSHIAGMQTIKDDIAERYRPYQGVALTHIFLICFTIITLYPVLWVLKMAVTPQQGFILGINPVPQPLVKYVNAWRRGDKAEAQCYRRAMAQNFREVMGQGSACYDQICSAWRRTKHPSYLKQVDAICQPFSTIWLRVPKIKVPASEARGTPEEIAQWRKQAIRQWRDSVLQSWQATSLATLRLTQPKAKQEAQKLLKEIALQQRERLQQGSLFWQQVLNSVLVALATTILGLFLACTAAYAFSRFRFPGRRMGLMSFLVSQMFPGTLMMIPLYILISRLGLLNSLLGLTLVYSTTSIPFCVWMLKGYFDTIPKELEEAALIDGASRTLIFWKIMLPLARPAIAVTALFSFMTAWNEFILAVTFMNDKTSFTLPVMLQQYVGSHNTEWGHFAAGAVLVSLPIVLLFFLLQRNLVSGLTAGGVKG
jgi:arabinogalactan oligomer/maltooligosaccharide transport system permease protein